MSPEEKQIKFLELFELCRESLVRFSRAMTRKGETAKDIVQETILRAYDSFEKIKNPIAFKSYLFSIASRTYKRANWRRRLFFVFQTDEDLTLQMETLESMEASTDGNYDVEALWNAISKLPEKQKEANLSGIAGGIYFHFGGF